MIVLTLFVGCGYFLFISHNYRSKINGILSFKKRPIRIQVQPFGDLSASQVSFVYDEIRKVYSNTVLLKPVALPSNSYYVPRDRYKADSIIHWLSNSTPDSCVTIGLTSKDISTVKGDIKDWGVIGLGFQPGKACVVSTSRLSNKNLSEQFFKVSLHELGHTQGLEHCENKACFMRDAEGHNTTDEEYEFCPKCRSVLIKRGWVFKS